jgi:uncharacterized protein (DUF433 family)
MSIVTTADTRHGVPRVEGTRITVIDVYKHVVEFGKDPAEVAAKFDISMGEVHEALAYYYNNAEEMQAEQAAIEDAHEKAIGESSEP